MKILFLDTETTGLPEERNISVYNTEKWPYVIQLSYIIIDTDMNEVVHTYDSIIKLEENVNITEKSITMHGITKEQSHNEGVDISNALIELNENLMEIDLIVGHNISFDKKIMIVENIRKKIFSLFPKKTYFCTMKNYTEFCNMPGVRKDGSNYIRYPKLVELYEKLFDSVPENLHNSYKDVLVCARCYMKKEYDNDILETSKTFNMEWMKC